MSSQRTRSCQGPLSSHALLVPARALREQFQLGLGARLLSGIRRQRATGAIAERRGKAVASCYSLITAHDPPACAGAGAGALAQARDGSITGAGHAGARG